MQAENARPIEKITPYRDCDLGGFAYNIAAMSERAAATTAERQARFRERRQEQFERMRQALLRIRSAAATIKQARQIAAEALGETQE